MTTMDHIVSALLSAILLLLALPACHAEEQCQNVAEAAAANNLTKLAISAVALVDDLDVANQLLPALSDSSIARNRISMFLPTDSAFPAAGSPNSTMMKPIILNSIVLEPLSVRAILRMLPGQDLRAAGFNKSSIVGPLNFKTDGNNGVFIFSPTMAQPAKIINGDIQTCIGVLHIIDRLLETDVLPSALPPVPDLRGAEATEPSAVPPPMSPPDAPTAGAPVAAPGSGVTAVGGVGEVGQQQVPRAPLESGMSAGEVAVDGSGEGGDVGPGAGMIAGVSIGVAVTALVALVAVFIVLKRNSRKPPTAEATGASKDVEMQQQGSQSPPSAPGGSAPPHSLHIQSSSSDPRHASLGDTAPPEPPYDSSTPPPPRLNLQAIGSRPWTPSTWRTAAPGPGEGPGPPGHHLPPPHPGPPQSGAQEVGRVPPILGLQDSHPALPRNGSGAVASSGALHSGVLDTTHSGEASGGVAPKSHSFVDKLGQAGSGSILSQPIRGDEAARAASGGVLEGDGPAVAMLMGTGVTGLPPRPLSEPNRGPGQALQLEGMPVDPYLRPAAALNPPGHSSQIGVHTSSLPMPGAHEAPGGLGHPDVGSIASTSSLCPNVCPPRQRTLTAQNPIYESGADTGSDTAQFQNGTAHPGASDPLRDVFSKATYYVTATNRLPEPGRDADMREWERYLDYQLDSLQGREILGGLVMKTGRGARLHGGQAVVQMCVDPRSAQEYAIKFYISPHGYKQEASLYKDSNQPLGRFLPEVHCIVNDPKDDDAQWLRDKHGVPLPPCIVMEKGESLDFWVARCGDEGLDMVTGLQVLTHVAERLTDLHECGYVHRDIKPGNIMWLPRNNRWTLIDFGCAARIGTQAPQGFSFTYAAPEAIKAYKAEQQLVEVAEAVDVWSIGILAVEMFTGQPPFSIMQSQEKTMDMILGVHKAPWEADDTAPAILRRLGHLREAVLAALSRTPQARPSMPGFLRACHNVLSRTYERM